MTLPNHRAWPFGGFHMNCVEKIGSGLADRDPGPTVFIGACEGPDGIAGRGPAPWQVEDRDLRIRLGRTLPLQDNIDFGEAGQIRVAERRQFVGHTGRRVSLIVAHGADLDQSAGIADIGFGDFGFRQPPGTVHRDDAPEPLICEVVGKFGKRIEDDIGGIGRDRDAVKAGCREVKTGDRRKIAFAGINRLGCLRLPVTHLGDRARKIRERIARHVLPDAQLGGQFRTRLCAVAVGRNPEFMRGGASGDESRDASDQPSRACAHSVPHLFAALLKPSPRSAGPDQFWRWGALRQAEKYRRFLAALIAVFTFGVAFVPAADAHEILPAITDMERDGTALRFETRLNLEGILSGIDLATVANSDLAPEAADYDGLRELPPARLEARFREFWPEMAADIRIRVDGRLLRPEFDGIEVPDIGDPRLTRSSVLRFHVEAPEGARLVEMSWAAGYGAMVLRQNGVANAYDGYLEPGEMSKPIALAGGGAATALQTFLRYIPVGFDHIVPKGLDHILFVLGLFFFSTRLRPLLTQISAFTLAHTITLAAAALGYVRVPAAVVEPVIAASIVFIAVENILSKGESRLRPLLVFCFGLLHGLGFASVLGEFGLPDDGFLAALIGFNIGVEIGQIAVIAAAYALLIYWVRAPSPHFAKISFVASIAIAVVGAYWFGERIA